MQDLTLYQNSITPLLLEEIGMRARSDKYHHARVTLVNQQEITANMALPMVCPVALEGVVLPLRW